MEKVTSQNPDKKYFTQVCNLIDELDLSPLAIALYFHYKRFSQTGSTEHPGVKFLMKKFKCGAPAIAAAKKELSEQNLISVTRFPAKDGRPDEVEILDIWERNIKHFQSEIIPVANQQRVENPLPTTHSPVAEQSQTRCQLATDPLPTSNGLKDKEFKEVKNLNNCGGGSSIPPAPANGNGQPPPPPINLPPKIPEGETRADYLLRKQIEYPHLNVELVYADFKRKCGSEKYPKLKDSQRSFDKWLETQDIEFEDEKQKSSAFDKDTFFAKKYGGLKTNAA